MMESVLSELHVENLGVIRSVDLVVGDGLTVITGETGAGKTMLVEALDLVVGGRADPTVVRPGADEARIDARFVDETVERSGAEPGDPFRRSVAGLHRRASGNGGSARRRSDEPDRPPRPARPPAPALAGEPAGRRSTPSAVSTSPGCVRHAPASPSSTPSWRRWAVTSGCAPASSTWRASSATSSTPPLSTTPMKRQPWPCSRTRWPAPLSTAMPAPLSYEALAGENGRP